MNIGANQKVAVSLVLHFEKAVESQVRVEVSNRAIHEIGRDPDLALAIALADAGVNFQSIGSWSPQVGLPSVKVEMGMRAFGAPCAVVEPGARLRMLDDRSTMCFDAKDVLDYCGGDQGGGGGAGGDGVVQDPTNKRRDSCWAGRPVHT